jgi:hypothetical protein
MCVRVMRCINLYLVVIMNYYPLLDSLMEATNHLQEANLSITKAQASIVEAHKKSGYITEWPAYNRITKAIEDEINRIRKVVQQGQFEK